MWRGFIIDMYGAIVFIKLQRWRKKVGVQQTVVSAAVSEGTESLKSVWLMREPLICFY